MAELDVVSVGCATAAVRQRRLALLFCASAVTLLLLTIYLGPQLPLHLARHWAPPWPNAAPMKHLGSGRFLLVSYMRSGSSFTAELLSLHPTVNYLFEPLVVLSKNNKLKKRGTTLEEQINFLTKIFTCDPVTINITANHRFSSRGSFDDAECRLQPLIVKAIRVHGSFLEQLLAQNANLKIIHLVRDPRATMASRMNFTGIQLVSCDKMRENLALAEVLTATRPDRYTLVRYEDLVDRCVSRPELERLYQFMGVPFPYTEWRQYMQSHYSINITRFNRFKTFRRPDYDPNHWKDTLNVTMIQKAEFLCSDVMQTFGYE